MTIDQYFSEVSAQLRKQAKLLSDAFSSHHPSSGTNKERLISDFINNYVPKKFTVDTGIVMDRNGVLSNEADIVIADSINNAPLFPDGEKKLWPVESVYEVIEVKSTLTKPEMENAIEKCRRFKRLSREFAQNIEKPANRESLFTIWAFEGPEPKTIKENYVDATREVPENERPDFVVVIESMLMTSGGYWVLSKYGHPSSKHYRTLPQTEKSLYDANKERCDAYRSGGNTLLMWLIWHNSWLANAGARSVLLATYLPNKVYAIPL